MSAATQDAECAQMSRETSSVMLSSSDQHTESPEADPGHLSNTAAPLNSELPPPNSIPEVGAISFTLFSKLPPKLRRMVWSFALASPRIIDVNPCWSPHLRKPANSVTLMSVCQESRLISMECYDPVTLPSPQSVTHRFHPFYFSAANDICFLKCVTSLKGWRSMTDQTCIAFRDSIRTLAIDPLFSSALWIWQQFPWLFRKEAQGIVRGLAKFPSLQQLILLKGPDSEEPLAEMMRHLRLEALNPSLGLDRIPLVLEDITRVTCLPYECSNRNDALLGMKRALRAMA
jgi:hypothetical protein